MPALRDGQAVRIQSTGSRPLRRTSPGATLIASLQEGVPLGYSIREGSRGAELTEVERSQL
jgi:hypothetical protein